MDMTIDQCDSPRFISMPHALLADGRQMCFEEYLPKETLSAYVKRNAINVHNGALYVLHNGFPVPDTVWKGLRPKPGDLVQIRARMEGGGGGNKVLRTVALIAVSLSAPYIAGAMQGLALGTAATGIGGAALTAGVMIGGSLLIGPLVPEPK